MKNIIIILLSVIILISTGCGNTKKPVASGNIKQEEKVTESTTGTVISKSEEKTSEKQTTVKEKETTVAGESITTEAVSEAVTEKKTESVTEKPTEAPTEASAEIPTEAPTEVPTEIPTEALTEAPKPWYNPESAEYQAEVKRLAIYYINQYRASEGTKALTESQSASKFAQARSVQLTKHFAHDVAETRALATEMKYGKYIDPVEYGSKGEPYYEPWGIEAITTFGGNQYNSADEIAQHIARNFYRSKEHWNYVGGVVGTAKDFDYCGIGVSYYYGGWYCCFIVQDVSHDD